MDIFKGTIQDAQSALTTLFPQLAATEARVIVGALAAFRSMVESLADEYTLEVKFVKKETTGGQ